MKHRSSIAPNGRDFSRFNGLNPLIKEVPKGIPTDKIPTDKRKPEGISFIGSRLAQLRNEIGLIVCYQLAGYDEI